jgi:hypothetical protein
MSNHRSIQWERGHTPRGLRDVGHQSAWIFATACLARDAGCRRGMTRFDTAALHLFVAELGQAVAPGAVNPNLYAHRRAREALPVR